MGHKSLPINIGPYWDQGKNDGAKKLDNHTKLDQRHTLSSDILCPILLLFTSKINKPNINKAEAI